MALDIAGRVLQRTVADGDPVVLEQIARAIDLLGSPAALRISISPLDRELVENALPGILEQARLTDGVDLVESDEVERGGCIVSSGGGSVDARIETQLDRIADALVPGRKR